MIETCLDGQTRVLWFDSAAEFAGAADAGPVRKCDSRWTGETWGEALAGAARGRTSLVADAEKLLEQVQAEVSTPRSEWVPARAGAFPVVPEVLAGFSEPMRAKVWVPSDRAPVKVFVDLVSSGGIDHTHLARRGVAALALAMALSAERALELYVVMPMRTRSRVVLVAQVPTAPLDLATACYALTSVGFVRGLGYSLGASATGGAAGGVDWVFGYYPDSDERRATYVARLRAALGAADTDLIVPPTFLRDPMVADPVEFVRRSLAEHAGDDA